ncbi:MAG: hypothetical protein E7171_02770 [Firmicutes bacterium]|nr:hypothetical protein [Bacillota bacterium]
MFKELIDKYLRRKKVVEEKIQPVEEKQVFDISISRCNNVFMVDVSDYVTIGDYVERMHEIDNYNLLDLIGNAVLWNSKRQRVNKGTYYVIMHDGYLYNILLGEEETIIDERVKVDDHTVEKHIDLHKNGDYNFTHFKHDKVGSTYYTMYYSKKGFPIKNFELSKEDAYELISDLLSRFELVPSSDNILDVNMFRDNVLDDLVPKSDGVSKK